MAGVEALGKRMGRRALDDRGSAVVEFVALSLVMLIPLVYLVLCISRVQAGAFAAEAAAYDAARAVVVEGVRQRERGLSADAAMGEGVRRAHAVTDLAVRTWGFESRDTTVSVRCEGGACLDFGSSVAVDVTVGVALPGVPGFLRDAVPLEVRVTSTSRAPVDGLAEER